MSAGLEPQGPLFGSNISMYSMEMRQKGGVLESLMGRLSPSVLRIWLQSAWINVGVFSLKVNLPQMVLLK